MHMDGGPRKVRQATDVIEVQVGLDDVADVSRIEAQRLHLRNGSQGRVDHRLGVARGEAPTEPEN